MKRMKQLIPILVCFALGCGSKAPPLGDKAKSLVKTFDQQLPKRSAETFKQLCGEVEKLHDAKKLTDEEFAALHKVCGAAKDGQWDRAQTALKPLLEAEAKK